jgi:hypothetical protein
MVLAYLFFGGSDKGLSELVQLTAIVAYGYAHYLVVVHGY